MLFKDAFIPMFTMSQYIEMAIRFLAAAVCGAVIGLERGKRQKEAGLRTHLIVCAASALMMIVSKYGFSDLVSAEGVGLLGTKGIDAGRIAAQVVSGVGFIGAGVIFHNDSTVKGLTTAAGLWATAGIGLVLGSGMYVLGLFATVVIVIVQTFMHKYVTNMDNIQTLKLSFTVKNSPEFRKKLYGYLKDEGAEVLESSFQVEEGGLATYELTLHLTGYISIEDVNSFFESDDEIKSVKSTLKK